METVTDAALGNADALKEVDEATSALTVAERRGDRLSGSQMVLADAAKNVRDAVKGEADSIDDARRRAEQMEEATGNATDANEESADAAKSAADMYLEEEDAAGQLTKTLDSLIDKIGEANGVNQDAITASLDYNETLDEVQAQIDAIANGQEGYVRTLDEGNEAGRENVRLLQDQAKDAQAYAEAQYLLDGNTGDYLDRLDTARDKFIENANQLTDNTEKVEELADSIFSLPDETEIEVFAETTKAEEAMQRLQDWMSKNPMVRRVNLESYELEGGRTVSADGFANAHGNVIESYANGGHREQHVAQMARAGAYRVWAEPETGGESYIPHALEKRARSEQLMAETASILGGTYIPAGAATSRHAAGSVSGSSSSAARLPRLELVNKTGANILDYIDIRIEGSRQSDDDYLGGMG